MATNKHAMIRYQALDACFGNRYRKFFIEDLVSACNDALEEFYVSKQNPFTKESYQVKKRTVFTDISYMQSESGYNAPIKRYYEGHRCYYRYSDENFSINKRDFSEVELDKLDEALVMLNRLNGEAGFDWVSEFIANFEDKLGRSRSATPVIGYEKNPFLTGIENLSTLYNSIVHQKALKISYRHFTKGKISYTVHPYYLKQYNNRWFLFGITEQDKNNLINLPLDRIGSIEVVDIPYIPNTKFNFEEYFEDVVGVSVPREGEPEKVVLKFDKRQYPYIITKPLHPSQAILDDENCIVQLTVFLTRELESLIFSQGDQVEVLAPASLRERFREKTKNLTEKYNCVE